MLTQSQWGSLLRTAGHCIWCLLLAQVSIVTPSIALDPDKLYDLLLLVLPKRKFFGIMRFLNLYWITHVFILLFYWNIVNLQCCIISGIQHRDSYIYIFFFVIFPIWSHKKLEIAIWCITILNIVLWALQQDFVVYIFYR